VILLGKFVESFFVFGALGGLAGAIAGAVWLPDSIFQVALAGFALAFVLALFYFFALWRQPVFFVTDRRVIFDHRKSFFAGKKAEIRLENISEIVGVRKNFLNSLFGFGTIIVSPLSGTEKFRVPFMPKARKVTNLIVQFCEKNFGQQQAAAFSNDRNLSPEDFLKNQNQVLQFFPLNVADRNGLLQIESPENRGTFAVLQRPRVFCLLRNGKINFPESAICSLPSLRAESALRARFGIEHSPGEILLAGFEN